MALAFDDLTTRDFSRSVVTAPSTELGSGEHERMYRKFVFFAQIAACAVPFFVAFVLYWTT